MVGIVIVSHSAKLAEDIVELARLMAPDAAMAAAGGLEDGSFGTSFEKIQNAIDSVNTGDGAVVLMDMGSSVMTTEMVLEMMDGDTVKMADGPIVEGAVAAAVSAANGADLDRVLQEIASAKTTPKF